MPAESRIATVAEAHLDYAHLQDGILEDDDEFKQEGSVWVSMTILVMLETLCESTWAYTMGANTRIVIRPTPSPPFSTLGTRSRRRAATCPLVSTTLE